MPERRTGRAGARVAENVRAFRKRRGMSTYGVAGRLAEIGWPMAQTAVSKIECGQRTVSADDLIALSIALGTSPNALLFGREPEAGNLVPVLNDRTLADAVEMWQWADGELPLALRAADGTRTAPDASGMVAAMFRLEAGPHRWQEQ